MRAVEEARRAGVPIKAKFMAKARVKRVDDGWGRCKGMLERQCTA